MVYEGGAELKKSKKLSHGLWTAPKLNVKFDQVIIRSKLRDLF